MVNVSCYFARVYLRVVLEARVILIYDNISVSLPDIVELQLPDVWHNHMQHVVFQFHSLHHDVVLLPLPLVMFLNWGLTPQVYPELQVVYIPSMVEII